MLPPFIAGRVGTRWAYVLACAPAVALVALVLWIAFVDLQMKRIAALRAELGRLRLEETRRAGGLEAFLEARSTSSHLDSAATESTPVLSDYFSREGGGPSSEPPPHRLYAAVVDEAGTILWHTDPQQTGKRLGNRWYERRAPEGGPDVVWLKGGTLSGGLPAYDVHLPLRTGGRSEGEYHFGLDGRWAAQAVAARGRAVAIRWSVILAAACAIGVAAVAALWYLRRRQAIDRLQLLRQSRARTRELSQLGGGLAHEVRNPLHALRINIHTLRRALSGRGKLSEDQTLATLHESDAAIDRLDALMRDLLQFTDPASGTTAELEVSHEVQATLSLLSEDLRRDEIQFRTEFPAGPALVVIDPARMRQMLLNVLTFAQHRAGKQGTIAIEVSRSGDRVEVAVTDSGPALPADQITHLFEPFQAPAETGSGLGLALVQTYAEATGGRAALERSGPTGNRLRIWLPLAASSESGVSA